MNPLQKQLVQSLRLLGIDKPSGVGWRTFLTKRLTRFAASKPELQATIERLTSFLPNDFTLSDRCQYLLHGYTDVQRCLNCGTGLKYRPGTNMRYCSNRCSNSHTEVIEKKKATCRDNFGVDFPQQSVVVQETTRDNNQKRYGNVCSLHGPEVRQKVVATNQARYGADHNWSARSSVRSKCTDTLRERYGVEHHMQSREIRARLQATNLKLYGYDRVYDCGHWVFELI